MSVLDDTNFEREDGAELDVESDAGFFGTAAIGYLLPQGPFNIRLEGELAVRTNLADSADDGTIEVDALDNSDISSIAGMLNAHLDYYILPNTALSLGAGIGYGTVQADLAVDLNGVDTSVFDEEPTAALLIKG